MLIAGKSVVLLNLMFVKAVLRRHLASNTQHSSSGEQLTSQKLTCLPQQCKGWCTNNWETSFEADMRDIQNIS